MQGENDMECKVLNSFVAENIIEIEQYGMVFLDGWNGYTWNKCFRCIKTGYPVDKNEDYMELEPVYEPVDEDEDQYELVAVKIL